MAGPTIIREMEGKGKQNRCTTTKPADPFDGSLLTGHPMRSQNARGVFTETRSEPVLRAWRKTAQSQSSSSSAQRSSSTASKSSSASALHVLLQEKYSFTGQANIPARLQGHRALI